MSNAATRRVQVDIIGGQATAATRQDLYVVREWLRRADRDAEPFAGRIMKPDVREALRRIIDNIEVRDANA